MTPAGTLRIGIVSDTHDVLLAALHDALAGVDEILHAGDIASAEALAEIRTIAPVIAVRGNMDERALADRLPEEEVLTRGGVRIALVHGHRLGHASVNDLAKRFEDRGVDLVVWGHIHEPVSELRNGVRYFNPGTAGGIGAPATCGILTIPEHDFTLEHISLV
ncbi:MAG TPA: metallophosphoesterase family protein [Gemmatimonadota bacterium]|nr:metallophosphoesterase family protein [Gemmatimonadota bacterium]